MRWKSSEYKSKLLKQVPQERLDLILFSLDLFLSRSVKDATAFENFVSLTESFKRNLPFFGRTFLRLNCMDIIKNSFIRIVMVTEIMSMDVLGNENC